MINQQIIHAMALRGGASVRCRTACVYIFALLMGMMATIEAQAQANIDLGIARLMQSPRSSRSALSDSINIIIDVDPQAIEQLPANVKAYAGGVAVARVATADLDAIRHITGVKAIRSSQPMQLHLAEAREMGDVGPIHAGTDLPQAYDGSGVTVGIVDIGFEPNHPAFRVADGTSTRVKYFAKIAEDTIIDTSTPEEIALITTDDSTQFHATHTTSIAAGGYAGGQYYGVAPNADLVMAAIDLELSEEACVLAGSQVVAGKIRELGQPGVMSMSIGSLGSPHDASNLSARFLDAIAAEVPFCMSAGNDGHYNRCVRLDFSEGDTEKWVLSYGDRCWQYLTFWAQDAQPFNATAYLYPKDKVNDLFGPLIEIDRDLDGEILMVDTDASGSNYSEDLARFVADGEFMATSGVYAGNEKYFAEWYLEFEKLPEDESKRIFLAFKIEAAPGSHVDCYAEGTGNIFYRPGSGNIRDWAQPTVDGTVSTLALGENILCVGACDSQEGDVTYFSSWGSYQLSDRSLPLVLAPGLSVVAALSQYPIEMGDFAYDYFSVDAYGQECYYGPQGGTSMSSPFVAGTIALWLQANPALTVAEIQQVIAATSLKNEYYYADSNPERWGAGIIDAYAGMKYVLANMGIGAVSADGSAAPLVKLVDGEIEITVAGNMNFEACLYDLSGRRLRSAKDNISVSGLPNGIYVVTVSTASGRYSYKILI